MIAIKKKVIQRNNISLVEVPNWFVQLNSLKKGDNIYLIIDKFDRILIVAKLPCNIEMLKDDMEISDIIKENMPKPKKDSLAYYGVRSW